MTPFQTARTAPASLNRTAAAAGAGNKQNKTKQNKTKQNKTKQNETNNTCDLVVVMFRSVYKNTISFIAKTGSDRCTIDCARKPQTKAGCYTAITMRSEKCGLNGFSNNGCLWNGMTAPFINYTIFGALWYQGNNDDAHFIGFYRNSSHLPVVCPSLNIVYH